MTSESLPRPALPGDRDVQIERDTDRTRIREAFVEIVSAEFGEEAEVDVDDVIGWLDAALAASPYLDAGLRVAAESAGGLEAAFDAVVAALPVAGWADSDGRWVIPDGVWDINIRHYPADGDGVHEPHYPDGYEATAEVHPNKRFVGHHADSPVEALHALALALGSDK